VTFVIALDEMGLGGKVEEVEDEAEEEEEDDDEEEDEAEEDDEEEDSSDSSPELESTMGLFNDGKIAGCFRTPRPGINIGCDRLRFLTQGVVSLSLFC